MQWIFILNVSSIIVALAYSNSGGITFFALGFPKSFLSIISIQYKYADLSCLGSHVLFLLQSCVLSGVSPCQIPGHNILFVRGEYVCTAPDNTLCPLGCLGIRSHLGGTASVSCDD